MYEVSVSAKFYVTIDIATQSMYYSQSKRSLLNFMASYKINSFICHSCSFLYSMHYTMICYYLNVDAYSYVVLSYKVINYENYLVF